MKLRELLQQEPFTLALSSGFFGFFAHYGFTAALREAALKPRRVTGASAGAVLAAAWSFGLSNHEIKAVLQEVRRETFWDPSLGFGFLKGERMEAFLREVFHGRRANIPMAISVFDIWRRRTVSFSEVEDVPRLVRASCAVPAMFHPVHINGRHYWDGGIVDKAALISVQPGEKVLAHFLPTQGLHSLYETRREREAVRERSWMISPEGLPQVGPYRLQQGMRAADLAYEFASRALNAPLPERTAETPREKRGARPYRHGDLQF